MIIKAQTIIVVVAALLFVFSCNPHQEQSPHSLLPEVVPAHGYVVPKDSIAEPKVIPAGKPIVVRAGKPKVILTNTNVHPAGIPKIVIAGNPRVCTPGKDSFPLPKTVPAIDSPFIAGIPQVVIAKDPYTKDQNPQNFSSFGKLQGLRSSTINYLLEDKSGNLWIGTNYGVSKYDGKSFTHFTVKEGLSSNWASSICEDKSGNLWFGTYDAGVTKYDGKSFTHFTIKEGLSDNRVFSIQQDKSGIVWFGTGGGVSRYDGIDFTHFTEKEGLINNNVWSILQDKSGNLWFGTEQGVNRYDGKSFIHFTKKEGLGGNGVKSILQDKGGDLWFGTEDGVSKYNSKSFTNFTEKEGLISNGVESIQQDESGNLWLGTDGGVNKYDHKSFTHFTEKEGLSDNQVNSILRDKRGNLWVGTQRGGVNKYDGKRFTHFTKAEGLSDNVVRSILQDRNGNFWFGTYGGGVNKYDGQTFTHFTTKEGMRINFVRSILEDKSGHLWFGDWTGVSEYDGKSFTYYTTRADMNTDMLQDKSGNFWFGSMGQGVFRYDGKDFSRFTAKEGLSGNYVSAAIQDKNGNLWFGTEHGLTKYDGKSFTHFTEREGLSDDDIFSIAEDKYGNIWVGTKSGGANKYDGKTFTHFTQKEGLSNNLVSSIMEDKSGNLWLGTLAGLNKIGKNKTASGLSDSVFLFKTYTYEDGFSGIGVNWSKNIYEAKDGTIWIGTDDRLTAYHPDEDTPDTIPPNIRLTGLSLFNENIIWQNLEKKIDTSIVLGNGVNVHDFNFDSVSRWYGIPEHLSLAYDNNNLTFQFLGIIIQSPKKVKYKYKLESLDKNWSALTNLTEVSYGNLPHGKYTFKVKAMNGDGYWSKELSYSFTIRPPWWQTWWAYAIYGLLFIAVMYAVYRIQKQRVIRIERERTKELELAQAKQIERAYQELKATQAQLIHSEKMASLGELTAGIAHEIQNPLNFVKNFSEVNRELIDEMDEEIGKGNIAEVRNIAKDIKENEEKIIHHSERADAIVKGMMQHSRASTGQKELTDINALADEYLRLSYHGLRAKDKSFSATIQTDFDQSIGQINIVSQDIGRVLFNLFNNAFYAVTEKKKQQGESYEPAVSVSTKKTNGKVEIRVKDNGNGIPQEVLNKIFQPFFTTKPTGQGTGLGLSLSYDIVKAHGGEIKVEQTGEIRTEFIINLPM